MGKLPVRIYEKLILASGLLSLAYGTLKIFEKIYETQTKPYIDEIFHIPQAQKYCTNIWTEWDPKITTLPGLYLVSYILLKPLAILKKDICTVYSLRYVNLIGTLLNFLLAYLITSKLHYNHDSRTVKSTCLNVLSAINITILPPLYFFTFLYYTDIWSLTFVLLMYYGHISSRKKLKTIAALSAFAAVMMRQTNIIWVGFVLMDNVWNVLIRHNKQKKTQDWKFTLNVLKSYRKYFTLSKKKGKRRKENKSNIFDVIKEVLNSVYPFLIVCILFVLFVILNGGVVVGDRLAHTVVFHPMQTLYFLCFAGFLGLPYFAAAIFLKRNINMYAVIILSAFAKVLSELNKLEHPYLLADNRHSAFYIWKRIFGHDIMRHLAVPSYSIAGIILHDILAHYNFMFKVFLAVCISVNLSLQHLFEVRYFIIPFVMCRLHFRPSTSVLFEFLYFSGINAFTVYIFINKPFSWASEPDVLQRFIW